MTVSFYCVFCGEKKILKRCAYSPGWFFRMKGLLGRRELAEGEGIWLNPCNSIHMFFMQFPIDAVFLDQENRIVKIFHNIQPWQATPILWNTRSVLEMPAGTAGKWNLAKGELLRLHLPADKEKMEEL